jgi:hypothetical protein
MIAAALPARPALAVRGRPKAALVVAGPARLEEAEVAAIRRRQGASLEWLDQPDIRRALEGFEHVRSAEAETEEGLVRAHERMRRVDLAGVEQALAEAERASARVAPTPEGRALVAELLVQRAILAITQNEPSLARKRMAEALSADPAMQLSGTQYPPGVIRLWEQARADAAAAPRVAIGVDSVPDGATVTSEGATRGQTPIRIELSQGPHLLWLTRYGSLPRLRRLEAAPGLEVSERLQPIEDGQRLRALVLAIRQADAAHRREPCEALRAALAVDLVVVAQDASAAGASACGGVASIATEVPSPLADPAALAITRERPSHERPWYRDGLGDTLCGVGVAGLVAGGALFLLANGHAQSANGSRTLDGYVDHAGTADDLRAAGWGATLGGSAFVLTGVARYLFFRKHP